MHESLRTFSGPETQIILSLYIIYTFIYGSAPCERRHGSRVQSRSGVFRTRSHVMRSDASVSPESPRGKMTHTSSQHASNNINNENRHFRRAAFLSRKAFSCFRLRTQRCESLRCRLPSRALGKKEELPARYP
ncbi:hypothetical protein ElyMa_005812300 [Elysia marginata]|uniref:Uncharacterized protein n=1 Tax=Elysia marginata TaxID=1093978 RepID=A0AAV4FXB9_9GAST|nr:hypothetical protein ElyMa_005812300 [Elysia marginata]